jgi:hypothetical protein
MLNINGIKAKMLFFNLFFFTMLSLQAEVDKLRVMWEGDASSSAIIGWNQVSGTNPTLYFGTTDKGTRLKQYLFSKSVTFSNSSRGMNSKFVHLSGLKSNTIYYFVIADSDSISKRYYFKTAPSSNLSKVSMISGGDSRNYRKVRREANVVVSKVQPTCVLFSGDMTNNSSPAEWKAWLDDWQLTFSSNGRITPIVVARGNHEPDNQLMTDMFGLKTAAIYYSVEIGGDLLKVLTLNTLHPSAPAQSGWLKRELESSQNYKWKFVQYHHSISPHTSKKKMRLDLLKHWAPLFYKYGVDLAIESDAHVMKTTYPVKPSVGPKAERGFERVDDGTVYIGEGCWGAPLRNADLKNSWTRNSGSFNQVKLIFVTNNGLEVRTVPVPEYADRLPSFEPEYPFSIPSGFPIWEDEVGGLIRVGVLEDTPVDFFNTKEVVSCELKEVSIKNGKTVLELTTEHEPAGCTLEVTRSLDGGNSFVPIRDVNIVPGAKKQYTVSDSESFAGKTVSYKYVLKGPDQSVLFTDSIDKTFPVAASSNSDTDLNDVLNSWERFPRIEVAPNRRLRYAFTLGGRAPVSAKVLRSNRSLVKSIDLPEHLTGKHVKELDISDLGSGDYILLIFSNKKLIRKYRFRVSG